MEPESRQKVSGWERMLQVLMVVFVLGMAAYWISVVIPETVKEHGWLF